ncbi:MAG: hypothetical protein IT462_16170 [Planctomycetes bacterium]|nr:hypothetical protein [Planctomycetota bacterium]
MVRLMLLAALAAIACAPLMAQSQPKEGLRVIKYPLAVDGFCQLTPSAMVDKNDFRENLGMYGIRPAFILLLPEEATDDYGKIMVNTYKEMLTFADEVGKRLAKKADVVVCYYLEAGGDPLKPPAHVTQVKLKYCSLMAMEMWAGKFIEGDVLDLKFNLNFNSGLGAMNWLYVSELGQIGDSGTGSKDPKLEDNLKRVEKRIPLKGLQAEAMESLYKWNIGEALKKIAKAEAAAKPEDETWCKNYRAVAEKMEEGYRDLVAKPEQDRGYLVEYGVALAQLAKMLKGNEREKIVADELAELKKTDEYKFAAKAKPKYDELRREYYAVVVVGHAQSRQDYYRLLGNAHKTIKGKLEAFAKEYKGCAYAKRASSWVLTIKVWEALGRGETVVRTGDEEEEEDDAPEGDG